MNAERFIPRSLAAAALAAITAALAGCGANLNSSGQAGTLRVAMTDSGGAAALVAQAKPSVGAVSAVIVNVDHIEAVSDSGATVTLAPNPALGDSDGDGHPDFDLLKLSGQATAIVDATLPAGTYTQFRVFSPGEGKRTESSAVYAVVDGQKQGLIVPSGQQTGLKLVVGGNFVVNVDATTSFTLDFDVQHSLVRTGNGRLMLKPVVRGIATVTSGAVSGQVNLPGGDGVAATVTASADGSSFAPVTADASGKFSIPVLPAPATYDFAFAFTNADGVQYVKTVTGVDVAANATTTVPDVTFDATGGLTGTLVVPGLAADAALTVKLDDGTNPAVTVNADGTFTLATVAPGTYDVTFSVEVGGVTFTATVTGVVVTDGQMTAAVDATLS